MMEKLAIQQPRLVNCSSPLLLQDNARPRTSRQTVAKLELRLECLPHPPNPQALLQLIITFFAIQTISWKEKSSIPMGQSKPPPKILLILASTIFSAMESINHL
ncbi:Histone-lysine N-methyltransferase SETMAR [Eumeta japonica]|uniref:Histone-lysine N-methyltransferase SETMAR n=1 Tax=Eumeta variegata TaxID=151549 RepID=A0A4C1X7E0_EUMVA|nr:Histone-lysine N-methyltransferase SETMAR [Eumeta japonica]